LIHKIEELQRLNNELQEEKIFLEENSKKYEPQKIDYEETIKNLKISLEKFELQKQAEEKVNEPKNVSRGCCQKQPEKIQTKNIE